MKKVYVAGPMSKGDMRDHLRAAIDAGDILMLHGLAPFMPQLSLFWGLMGQGWEYEEWMRYDRAYLLVCDALLRLPGESAGADREIKWANEAKIPVFTSMNALLDWANAT